MNLNLIAVEMMEKRLRVEWFQEGRAVGTWQIFWAVAVRGVLRSAEDTGGIFSSVFL